MNSPRDHGGKPTRITVIIGTILAVVLLVILAAAFMAKSIPSNDRSAVSGVDDPRYYNPLTIADFQRDPRMSREFKAYVEASKAQLSTERVRISPPSDIFNWMGVKDGSRVADFGAGNGYFTIPLAVTVGKNGRVYAIDRSEYCIRYIEKRLQLLPELKALGNVELIFNGDDPDSLVVEPGTLDFVLMSDVHILNYLPGTAFAGDFKITDVMRREINNDKAKFVKMLEVYNHNLLVNVSRSLKPDGKFVFIEDLENSKRSIMNEKDMIAIIESQGFELRVRTTFPADDDSYLIFGKKEDLESK